MAIRRSYQFVFFKKGYLFSFNNTNIDEKSNTRAGLNPDPGRCDRSCAAGSSKIKIRASLAYKAHRAKLTESEF